MEVGTWARLWFGRTNIGIWETSLAVEFGDTGRATEISRGVRTELIPSPSRQAEHYCDLGRALLTQKARRDEGLSLLLRAEHLAPQRVRTDVFVREAIADQIRVARRDAGSRELRGLAYRIGVAPVGTP